MSKSETPIEKLTYEQAFNELEIIVEKLENEQVSLEDAMNFFERGQALRQHCASLLEKAELKLREIKAKTSTNPEDEETF